MFYCWPKEETVTRRSCVRYSPSALGFRLASYYQYDGKTH